MKKKTGIKCRSIWKTTVLIGLCAGILLSDVSCKKTPKEDEDKKKQTVRPDVVLDTDPYFSAEEFELAIPPEEGKEIETCSIDSMTLPVAAGKTIMARYSSQYKMPEDLKDTDDPEIRWDYMEDGKALFDLNGKLIRKYIRSAKSTETLSGLIAGPDGESYVMVNRTEPEAHTWICKIMDSGDLEEGFALEGEPVFMDDGTCLMTKDGKILIGLWEQIKIYNKDGSLLKNVMCEGFQGKLLYQDNKYYATIPEAVREIDTDAGALKGEKIPNTIATMLTAGRDGSYRQTNNGAEKVNVLNPSERQTVMEWDQTDYDNSGLSSRAFFVLSDNELVGFKEDAASYDQGGDNSIRMKAVHLVRQDKNPYVGRPIIRIAENRGTAEKMGVRSAVIRYNTDPSSKNRILIHDYSAGVDPTWTALQGQVSTSDAVYQEILSGSGPDILVNFADYSQFGTSGFLLDLNPLLDAQGSGIDRTLYFDNVIRAGEVDGKLYHLPLVFSLYGMVGNPDLLGEPKSWTVAEFTKILDSLPDTVKALEPFNADYDNLMPALCGCSFKSMVDYEKRKVCFESEGFYSILDLAKKYGSNPPSNGDFFDYTEYFRDGTLATLWREVRNLREYAQYMALSDKAAYYPIPSVNASGLTANVELSVAISAKSAHQQEAWDFVRFLLGKDQLEETGSNLLSVNREVYETSSQALIHKCEEAKANADDSEITNIYQTLQVDKTTADELKKLIESISQIRSYDPAILTIILEEAPAYYTGQKTAEEVGKIIANRTSTVVKER